MATQTRSIAPAEKDFMQAARAQAGGPPPSTPKTPPASSGNSEAGNSNSGSSGGSGGGGGKSGGGRGDGSASEPKRPEKNWRALILTGAAVTGALVTLGLATWSITPAGQKSKEITTALSTAQEETKQTEAETKRLREERRLVEAKGKAGITTQASTPSCQTVSTSAAKRRVDAVTLSYGQCVEFVASPTDRWFWVILSSIPTSIEGRASFGHLREETEVDKAGRRQRCMADSNDTQFCDKEMQISRGVRVDDCVTKFTQDNCLGYLQGKPKTLPLIVNTDERIRINM